MTATLPGTHRCCQNVGCRQTATKRFKLQNGKYQWRCVPCYDKRSKSLLTKPKG